MAGLAAGGFEANFETLFAGLGIEGASAGAGSAASLDVAGSTDSAGASATADVVSNTRSSLDYFASLLALKAEDCRPVNLADFARHLDVLAENEIDFAACFRPLCTDRYRGLLPKGLYRELLLRSQSKNILIMLIRDILNDEASERADFLLQAVSGKKVPEPVDTFRLSAEKFCGFNVLHLAVSNLDSDAAVVYLKELIQIFPGLMNHKRQEHDFAPTPLALLQSLAHNNAGLSGSKYAQQVLGFYVDYLQGKVSKETKSRLEVEDNLRAMTGEVEKYKADLTAAELLALSGSGAGAGSKKKKKPKKGKKAPRAKAPETDAAAHSTEAEEHRSALAEKNAAIKRLESGLAQVKSELGAALKDARTTSRKVAHQDSSAVSSLRAVVSSLRASSQNLTAKNRQLKARLAKLEAELEKSKTENSSLRQQLVESSQRLDAITEEKDKATKALKRSKNTNASLVEKMGKLNTEIQQLKGQAAVLPGVASPDLVQARVCLEVLEARNNVFYAEICNLNQYILSLNSHIVFLQNCLTGEKVNRSGLETFNASLHEAYSELRAKFDQLKWQESTPPPLPPEPASAESAAAAPPEAPQSVAAASAGAYAAPVAALFKKAAEDSQVGRAKKLEASDDAAAESADPKG